MRTTPSHSKHPHRAHRREAAYTVDAAGHTSGPTTACPLRFQPPSGRSRTEADTPPVVAERSRATMRRLCDPFTHASP